MIRSAVMALVIGTIAIAAECSPNSGEPTRSPSAVPCSVMPSVLASDTTRIRLGPLWAAGFDSTNPPTVLWKRGYPSKLLLQAADPVTTILKLTGWACSDGRPLRFWYHEGIPFSSVPASDQAMASTGDSTASLDFVSQPNSKTGYLLFIHTELWMVRLVANEQDNWTVGIVVQAQPQPT